MSKTSSSPALLDVQYQEPDDLHVTMAFNKWNLQKTILYNFSKLPFIVFCLFVLDWTMSPRDIFLSTFKPYKHDVLVLNGIILIT